MNRIVVALFIGVLLFAGCKPRGGNADVKTQCVKQSSLPVKYAKGFTLDYYDGFKVATVHSLLDSGKIIAQYVILPKGKAAPVGFENALLIDTPVTKIVCISTTHIAELERLGLVDKITAVTNVPLIYDSAVNSRVETGEISDIGTQEVNYEKLVQLNPSFVIVDGNYDGGSNIKSKLTSLHIKSVLNLDYLEQDPLARVEWLKFVGAFNDREFEADSIFKVIEGNYLSLKAKVEYVKTKPTVLCNLPVKEIWYMPSKETYVARMIADAGGDFIWKDAKATNGLNLNLDYETVYDKAANADVWVYTGFANSLEEIKQADRKNAYFKAFRTGEVYNNNKRRTASGGIDWWESGIVNPDKILADLIFIFHPDLMPGYQPYYYQKLK